MTSRRWTGRRRTTSPCATITSPRLSLAGPWVNSSSLAKNSWTGMIPCLRGGSSLRVLYHVRYALVVSVQHAISWDVSLQSSWLVFMVHVHSGWVWKIKAKHGSSRKRAHWAYWTRIHALITDLVLFSFALCLCRAVHENASLRVQLAEVRPGKIRCYPVNIEWFPQ